MEIHPEEQPVSLQLFGSDPKIMSEMAKRIEERPFAILDINMGCPVPESCKKRGGVVALIEKPQSSCLIEIVNAESLNDNREARYGKNPKRVRRCACKCSRSRKSGGRSGSVGGCGSRKDERAVL